MEKKQEFGATENGKHIPNRIFRGRIVEFARSQHDFMSLSYFGKAIKKDYSNADESWLLDLCGKLSKEKLIILQQQGRKIRVGLGM